MNDNARDSDAGEGAATTPMMAQYLATKARHPDALLFYRMGDFYEMFFEDAAKAAAALDIVLTKRGKHEGRDIPMCGVPVHAADSYLQRLIRRGFRVAVCEQTEDPAAAKKRGAKAVRREVTRLVTPGTLTEDNQLDARAHNYLVALARAEGQLGLAWADISTGDLRAASTTERDLAADLARLAPGEILLPDRLLAEAPLAPVLADWKNRLAPMPGARFASQSGEKRLESLFGVRAVEGFGGFGRAEIAALGALVDYVELTQVGKLPRLKPPQREASGATMSIDPATRRNLELVETLSGERAGSLLGTIDRTLTGAGARLLGERLKAPLTDPVSIAARLDLVAYFVAAPPLRETLRGALRRVADLERALARLSVGRGGPRDLAALRDGLAAGGEIGALLAGAEAAPAEMGDLIAALSGHAPLVDLLARALGPDLPLLARDGGFVAPGFRPELDHQRELRG
ncbi:MAG: DNA mismatch repair protein MutS, partial [Alphaproteobacteria bacterium]|nr:DNA mismatch repair protein MutS [Alphaproteobacteria bacterium]